MLDTQPSPVIDDMARQRKILVLAAVAIGVLLLTTIVAVISTIIVLRNQRPLDQAPTSPEVAPPAAILIPLPSRFATDAGVLELKDKIASLSGQIDSVDLFETEIIPPNLDLHLSIAPQR